LATKILSYSAIGLILSFASRAVGQQTDANLDDLEEFEATAEVEAPPREVSQKKLDEETLTRVPGTRGDALRAIEVLPGVGRSSVNQGDPILRGAAQYESQTFLNGAPVPFLFHFGGLTSFMNSRLISRVDMYPSNFGVRYGRVTGGVIEVTTRDPREDRLHAALDLNLIDSSAFVEAPLTDKLSVALAARRSNIDFFFENFVPKDSYAVVAAPTYYDYQGLATYRINHDHKLRLMGYGSRDALELFFANPVEEDPSLKGEISGTVQFHRLHAELESTLSPGIAQKLGLTFGHLSTAQHFADLEQAFSGEELHARAEWRAALTPNLDFRFGGDFFGWFLDGTYRGPAPTQFEGNPRDNDPLATRSLVSGAASITVVRPAFYTELGYRPLPNLLLTPGVRVDYFGEIQALSVDPRLGARLDVTPATTLKWGVGLYSQPPEFWQSLSLVGNTELAAYRALHASTGVEQKLSDKFKLGVEGFYKRLYDRVVGTENGEAPHFVNDGRGRIYGAEASFEARPSADTFGYLAYTLSRSERQDRDGPYRLFDRDQTHVLTLAANHQLGRGWEIGARFRLVSGNPTTPVTGSVYDAKSGVYLAQYGAVNSDRNPTFHQLDVRVEKRWNLKPFMLAAYLDVQNAYNASNQEGVRYSYDYSRKESVSGLPIFPNLGLRGEL
jgi:hypothetical protein